MTLFSILRELYGRGLIQVSEISSPHLGRGEVFSIDGVRIRIITGVMGDLRNYAQDASGHFDHQVDVALNHDGSVLAYAPSCV